MTNKTFKNIISSFQKELLDFGADVKVEVKGNTALIFAEIKEEKKE